MLTGAFCLLQHPTILVVGDLMLDSYTMTHVARVSPEAPVPVAQVLRHESRAGGAGNVALNLRTLGAEVRVLGRVGMDPEGATLRTALSEAGCDVVAILEQSAYPTSVKNRVMAGNQQIVRVDREEICPLSGSLEQEAVSMIPTLLEGVDIVAISDYAKGCLTRSLLRSLLAAARSRDIPVIIDPKGTDFSRYSGASIVKPNEAEAYAAAGCGADGELDHVAQHLLASCDIGTLLITRSAKGIAYFQRPSVRRDFPVRAREVVDVTGAGDTVLAMLALSLGSGIDLSDATELANVAAGLAIETVGCARVSRGALGQRLLELHSEHKVFHVQHLEVLAQAVQADTCGLLVLQGRVGFTEELFTQLENLRSLVEGPVIVALLAEETEPVHVQLVSSLRQVDFVLIGAGNRDALIGILKPALLASIGESADVGA